MAERAIRPRRPRACARGRLDRQLAEGRRRHEAVATCTDCRLPALPAIAYPPVSRCWQLDTQQHAERKMLSYQIAETLMKGYF